MMCHILGWIEVGFCPPYLKTVMLVAGVVCMLSHNFEVFSMRLSATQCQMSTYSLCLASLTCFHILCRICCVKHSYSLTPKLCTDADWPCSLCSASGYWARSCCRPNRAAAIWSGPYSCAQCITLP